MRRANWYRWLLTAAATAAGLGWAVAGCEAAEECQRFLDGLRERRYFDVALDYLEQMRTSPLAGQDFKTVIDYEAGVTLKESARMGRVMSVREKQLAEARDMFTKFLAEHADHPLAAGANTQLANLLVERGRIKLEQADGPNRSTEEKKQLTTDARMLYREAEKVFQDLEQRFLEAHKKFPKFIEKKDTKLLEERDQVRRDLLQARLALATVVYEIAKTYEPGSQEGKKNLEAAAAKYKEFYEKYNTRLGGFYAHMWEGRCYKELGKTDEAFETFEDLLSQADESQPFRELKNKTMVLYLETTLLPGQPKYKKAMELAEKWLAAARGTDEVSPEGLAIKYLAGEASFQHARSLQKPPGDPKLAEQRKASMTNARQFLEDVADQPGEYQKQARALLRRKEFAGENVEIPEPANYPEARDRAKDALDLMQDPELKPSEVAKARDEAIKYYRMAIRMKTPDVEVDELNVIRYYLAYLHWMAGDVPEAAVMGEFLARRYSDGVGARQGARIALAAWVALYNEARPGDRQFESKRMAEIAEYITGRWAGEPEADEAWMMLIRTALSEGDLPKAQQYMENVSPDSPRRGEVELMTGQKLWGAYLEASRKQGADRPAQEQLDKMVQQARQTLQDGIARMRKPVDEETEITYTLLASVLSLAQIHIGAGEPDKAVTWLEDPKIGALPLVEANHAATDRGNFRVETYKAALRAYVAAQELEKAEKVMKELEDLISQAGGGEAGKKLTQIYISLGRELENQLERLRNEQETDKLEKVKEGFEKFLDRILQREEGNTFNSLNWVAETFFSLGAGVDPGGKKLPEEAKNYYQKAAQAYRNILTLCAEKKIEFQPGATTSIQIRLARCLRRLADYPEAIRLLKELLEKKATIVDAQVEAAYTYQAWGESRPAAYQLAIKGSTKYKEIWGWGTLARRVYGNKKYLPVFHEARYNLALCRFKLAQSKSGTEKKALLQQAQKDITVVQRQFPEMGRQPWYGKYDDLLKKIQSLRGVTASGLKGTETKEMTSAG